MSKEFKITKPVRMIELFAGYGSQYQALRRLRQDCESYKISEWCIPSNSSYKAMLEVVDNKYDKIDYSEKYSDEEIINRLIGLGLSVDSKNPINEKFLKRKGINWCRKVFNEYISTNNLGSITNIKANDLEIIDKDIYSYIMTYSFPCLTKDTLVLTDKGEKPIIDIKVGDKVFTHMNCYKKVLASKKTGYKNIFEVKTKYTSVKCTKNHKFYVRMKINDKELGNPQWVEAKDLNRDCYLAYVGDLYSDVIEYIPLEEIIDLGQKEDVYDIEVEDAHSFIANNVIVHNCQDLSLAGKQAGMSKGSNTRSGLLWEVERLLQESIDNNLELPDILLMENVPQVCNKKNEKDFNEWKSFLVSIGYKNFVQILNASDFGVPQNRKRCFMVSVLTNEDITYNFPKSKPLTKCVKDILEPFVDEKYYIKNDRAKELIKSLLDRGVLPNPKDIICVDGTINKPDERNIANCIPARYDSGIGNLRSSGNMVISQKPCIVKDQGKTFGKDIDVAATLLARDYKGLNNRGSNAVIEEQINIIDNKSVKQLGNILEEGNFKNPQCGRVYDSNACSPTLNICGGGNHEPKIIDTTIVAMRGRPIENPNIRQAGLPTKQRLELNEQGICNTLTTVQKDNMVLENIIYDDYNHNISKNQNAIGTLTPTCGNKALNNGKKIIEKVGQISNEGSQCGTVVGENGLFPTISAGCHGYANPHICTQYRIRKLTPKECGRLMDVNDDIIDVFSKIHSNSTLYKQFGNSIVVSVLYEIFKKMM